MADGNEISGPLGLWPFPILNTLIKVSGGGGGGNATSPEMKSWEVNRDGNGRISSIEKLEVKDDG